jgi:protein-tyrosine phosphatase
MSFGPHDLAIGRGWLALSPMPGRGGDLASDLERVLAWRPDLVVSMTEAAEMAPAKDMPHRLAQAGIGWRHFPITDYGIPDASAETEWPHLSAEVLARLDQGERVLVHCMGGCGRSGMIALRLMLERGEDPAAALQRLRAARPCAIETEAQLHWARKALWP